MIPPQGQAGPVPFRDGSRRLWSLWDMVKSFIFSDFGAHLTNMERAIAGIELANNPHATNPQLHASVLRSAIPNLMAAVKGLVTVIDHGDLPISHAVRLQVVDLSVRLMDFDPAEFPAIAENSRITRQAILNDLSQHLFFCVDKQSGASFDEPDPWGQAIAAAFADAKRDIEAATRCLALREWTATVFHSMRVLEHGLRPMATRFNVRFETDSWHKVIKGIEDGVTALRNKQGLSDFERSEITYYSDAATQFRHFKDAWRNHVSHAREHYDDREAPKVYGHVRDFMEHLANGV
jgi:hypothetical protein